MAVEKKTQENVDQAVFVTTLTVDAIISGDGGLTKNGANTLYLTGKNTYKGNTTINQGILKVTPEAINGTSGTVNTETNTTLEISVDTGATETEVSKVISGAGGVTKSGDNHLSLTGVNQYSGLTTIEAGTLILNAETDLGKTSGITMQNSAQLDIAKSLTIKLSSFSATSSNTIKIESNQTLTIDTGTSNP